MTEKIKHHWRREKIISLEEAQKISEKQKKAGKTIVTTNGSFDLLHAGHLDVLEEARQQGDVLFVMINSDRAIKEKKGPARPIIDQDHRAAMLAALICVDYVIIMDDYDNEPHGTFLPAIKPHVHVNGGNWGKPEEWVEWGAIEKLQIRPHTVTVRPGLSTSGIVEKIHKSLH